jgi:hypothetical protein
MVVVETSSRSRDDLQGFPSEGTSKSKICNMVCAQSRMMCVN